MDDDGRSQSLATANSPGNQARALAVYHRDKVAASAHSSKDCVVATWIEFHRTWFGDSEWLPLTVCNLAAVSAMYKGGGYRSFPNYLCRAKEMHIAAGFD